MQIEFDVVKRNKTLAERGFDFSRAVEVFNGPVVNRADNRANYGEPRTIMFGLLDGRWIVVIWTPRGKWIDQDDTPELTEDFFETATPMIGERIVTKRNLPSQPSKLSAIANPSRAANSNR